MKKLFYCLCLFIATLSTSIAATTWPACPSADRFRAGHISFPAQHDTREGGTSLWFAMGDEVTIEHKQWATFVGYIEAQHGLQAYERASQALASASDHNPMLLPIQDNAMICLYRLNESHSPYAILAAAPEEAFTPNQLAQYVQTRHLVH